MFLSLPMSARFAIKVEIIVRWQVRIGVIGVSASFVCL